MGPVDYFSINKDSNKINGSCKLFFLIHFTTPLKLQSSTAASNLFFFRVFISLLISSIYGNETKALKNLPDPCLSEDW